MRKLLLVLLIPMMATAQQKMLTVEDAVMKQRSTLGPARLMGLAWVPQSSRFTYIAKKDGKDCVVMQDAATLKRDTVLTLDQFNDIRGKAEVKLKPMERLPMLSWINETSFRFNIKQNLFVADIKTGKVDVFCYLPEGAENTDIETNTGKVAYVNNHNLWVSSKASVLQGGSSTADSGDDTKGDMLTKDGAYGLAYGTSVHRNEFGIDKGTFWSPKGNKIAYYQMNESIVTDYPIYNLNNKPASTKNMKYPMAGDASHVVSVYVHDFAKKRTVKLVTGTPLEQYLTNVAWHPGEEKIYIAVVNREQNEMKLNEYDAVSGVFTKTLFTETHPKYVEPEHPVIFCKNNPKQFIWMSERDGFNHMYLYNSNGRLERQLTKGKFDVTQFVGFNNKGDEAFYVAASEDGMNRYLYRVNLATGKSTKLTLADGTHNIMMNDNGEWFLDQYTSTTVPRNTVLLNASGQEKAVLLNAINPIAEYKKCEMEVFKIKAADGTTDLNCRMFLPAGFDANKKYPTLVYLYGGPHAQMITNSWLGGADLWLYYMAQQGYVVFTLDNRGSANRGLDFENVTHRKLGVEEKADQLKGIEYLKGLKYVDASRLGIYGWSFGGFMTTTMMSKTDLFKAGVAGGPVIDWGMYEIMYTERYMDTPKENPEGYAENNLLNHVKGLKGKLMLIHGTDDNVVLWQHSLAYIKKCVDEGVQLDYFVYPGHLHNVMGKDRVHLMQKITDYFKQNL
jgi:dipeptidyl-peptidase-4